MRFARFLPPLAALALLLAAAPGTRAEDEPAAPKEKTDSIASDWKKGVKTKGIAHAAERATHWEAKGVSGKDLFWLGLMWDRGQQYEKAIAAFEASLKVPDLHEKNRETAQYKLVENYGDLKDWAKQAAAAERFREALPSSPMVSATWVDQGRAHWLAGDKAKALAAFTQAADLNAMNGILELVDVHLAEGEADAAKAVVAKYEAADVRGKEATFAFLKDFLSVVGTKAPALAEGKSVGSGAAPTTFEGKPTLLFFWGMQMGGADQRLQRVGNFQSAYRDGLQVAAVSTYNKWSPVTNKKDEAMTEEAEADLYRQFIETGGRGMPSAIVVPRALIDGLKIKFDGQKLLLDKEGKIRYTRMTDLIAYDWLAVEQAVKKVIGG